MSEAIRPPVFPRSILLGSAALLLVSIALAGTASFTHNNRVILPPTTAVATRDLTFSDLPDGGVAVADAATKKVVLMVAPQTGAFLRGVVRGLVRGHRLAGKAPGASFRLTRWADGRLSIADPATHESFELEAFGATNEKVFAQLLEARGSGAPGAS